MSNVLIIKHGSLGELIQANGAIEDIKKSFKDSKVLLLTSKPYADLMHHCPYVDGVLTDKRLPRWNLFYLLSLKKFLSRYQFTHVFDLQNSSRTQFYNNVCGRTNCVHNTDFDLKRFAAGQNCFNTYICNVVPTSAAISIAEFIIKA